MPIGLISPSQSDDGRRSKGDNRAVWVYSSGGKFIITDGNHRYYTALEEGRPAVKVTVNEDPSY